MRYTFLGDQQTCPDLLGMQCDPGRDELVTQTEAARRLGVHPGTVSRWLAAGHFQTYTGAGKKPLLYASSLHRPTRRTRGKGRRKDQGHS